MKSLILAALTLTLAYQKSDKSDSERTQQLDEERDRLFNTYPDLRDEELSTLFRNVLANARVAPGEIAVEGAEPQYDSNPLGLTDGEREFRARQREKELGQIQPQPVTAAAPAASAEPVTAAPGTQAAPLTGQIPSGDEVPKPIAEAKRWRQQLDGVLTDYQKSGEGDFDEIVDRLDALYGEIRGSERKSDERDIAASRVDDAIAAVQDSGKFNIALKEAVMWLGMDLKAIHDDRFAPNPYPESKNPASAKIEPTADGLKLGGPSIPAAPEPNRQIPTGARVVAKFRVEHKSSEEVGGAPVQQIQLRAVGKSENGEDENSRFFQYTPSGEINLGTVNAEAADGFTEGGEYLVYFVPVAKAPAPEKAEEKPAEEPVQEAPQSEPANSESAPAATEEQPSQAQPTE